MEQCIHLCVITDSYHSNSSLVNVALITSLTLRYDSSTPSYNQLVISILRVP